jgi:hypothetical protein
LGIITKIELELGLVFGIEVKFENKIEFGLVN